MEQKPWRKVLYERQGYPDNFVDRGQFLNGLKKNCMCLFVCVCKMNILLHMTCHSSVHEDLCFHRSVGCNRCRDTRIKLVCAVHIRSYVRAPLKP